MKKLFLLCVLCAPCFATINAGMQWDVRTTGSDTNGGGYDASVTSPGTDFSQQNAAQVSFTDLIIGATTTQATSAAHPFNATYPGNVVNITGGTGCTVGRFEVLSVSGTTSTFDRSLGTAASTCAGNLGGSFANVSTAIASLNASYNTIFVQSGTYTFTAVAPWHPATAVSFSVVGYQSTHFDQGAKPLFTTSTNSINLIDTGGAQNLSINFVNLGFSNTATTRGAGLISNSGSKPSLNIADCLFDGFTNAISGGYGQNPNIFLLRTEIKNSTGYAITNELSQILIDCYLHDNAGALNIAAATPSQEVTVVGTLLVNNSDAAINSPNGNFPLRVERSAIVNTTGTGVHGNAINLSNGTLVALTIQGTIFYGNSGVAISVFTPVGSQPFFSGHNAFGANTGGDVLNYTKSSTDVALTTNPFTDSASGNYTLNALPGGGALLRGTGYPGTFPGALSTGHLDIGPLQSAGASSSAFACGFSKNIVLGLPRY